MIELFAGAVFVSVLMIELAIDEVIRVKNERKWR